MRNTTLSQTWFGAKGDAWTPFVNALTDLGLGVEILLPKRLMDTGPARGGVDEHGPYVRLAFELPRGSFATVVLREIMKADAHAAAEEPGGEA